ncbi:MAG: hypothetical protein [Microviridae sp.]|nr:MAG: hypothetical protein [Microviridae sp.]
MLICRRRLIRIKARWIFWSVLGSHLIRSLLLLVRSFLMIRVSLWIFVLILRILMRCVRWDLQSLRRPSRRRRPRQGRWLRRVRLVLFSIGRSWGGAMPPLFVTCVFSRLCGLIVC